VVGTPSLRVIHLLGLVRTLSPFFIDPAKLTPSSDCSARTDAVSEIEEPNARHGCAARHFSLTLTYVEIASPAGGLTPDPRLGIDGLGWYFFEIFLKKVLGVDGLAQASR